RLMSRVMSSAVPGCTLARRGVLSGFVYSAGTSGRGGPSSPSTPFRPAAGAYHATVTRYSPAGAPSPAFVVVSWNRPSSPVRAVGRGASAAAPSGWKVTTAPAAGLPLTTTFPATGTVAGPPFEHSAAVRQN